MKQVKQKRIKQRSLFLFYLCIVKHIKQYQKLPDYEQLGVSKQLLSYHAKTLKKAGIIAKIGYSVWLVDWDKWQQFDFIEKVKQTTYHTNDPSPIITKKLKKSIRGHAYIFKVHIPQEIKGHLLPFKASKYYEGRYINNNKQVYSTRIKGRCIWFGKKSITLFFKKGESIFGNSAQDCLRSAIFNIKPIITGIERNLHINIHHGKELLIDVPKSEYGIIKNELASQYNRENKEIKIYDKGKCWALVDNSFKLEEFELVDAKKSREDTDNVIQPFFNDMRKHYQATGESMTMGGILKIIEQQQQLISMQGEELLKLKMGGLVGSDKPNIDYIQ